MHDVTGAFDGSVPAAEPEPTPAAGFPPVRLGVLQGEIELGPDFDEPLPEFEPYVDATDTNA